MALAGWDWRREITVNNTGNAAKSNYQVKVELTSANFSFAKAESDGTDIRFTASNGETLLDFWRQDYDSVAETATFWVKVPTVPSNDSATIYIYYGNSGAADASSIDDAFHFGEDFRQSDTAKANLVGDVSEADGVFLANHDGFPNGQIAIHGGTGWRQVNVREQSNVVKVGETFYILVSGTDSSGNVDVGQYSASDIEGPWTEFASNPVIDLAEDPYIVVGTDGTPYNDGTHYYVYYERKTAGSSGSQADVGVARTTDFESFEVWDGSAWTGTTANHASILDAGGVGTWDEQDTNSPAVVHDGTNFVIVYEGRDGTTDQTGVARGSNPEGPFTKEASNPISALEVVDDLRLIGTTWWMLGHDSAGNMRRYTSATDGPADWDNTSFTQDGWNPFEEAGHSVNLVFDGTTALDGYATWQRIIGTTGINLVLLVGGDKWRPMNWPDAKNYERVENQETDREIFVDESSNHLTLAPPTSVGVGIGLSFGLMSQSAVLPAVDFAIHAQRRTNVNQSAGENAFTNIAFGTGDPDVDVTNNAEFYSYIHTGVLYSVFNPGSNGVQIREYSSAEAAVGTIDDDQAAPISDAVVQAFNEHIFSYINSGTNGTVAVNVGGTEYASGNPANDLTTGAKQLLIGQGQRADDDGGISDWQYLFARSWDGEDPTQTVGSEAAVEAAAVAVLRSMPPSGGAGLYHRSRQQAGNARHHILPGVGRWQ